jgi:hypothetical protein
MIEGAAHLGLGVCEEGMGHDEATGVGRLSADEGADLLAEDGAADGVGSVEVEDQDGDLIIEAE